MEFSTTHLRCSVHIDLFALTRNLGRIKDFMPTAKSYTALVTADAFGIGIKAAVARLMDSNPDGFVATNLSEAIQIREMGRGWNISVLSASLEGEESFYFEYSLSPTLSSMEELKRFESKAKKHDRFLNVHLKIPHRDTKKSIPDSNEAKKMLNALLQSRFLKLEGLSVGGTGTGAPEEESVPCPEFLKYASILLKNDLIPIHHGDVFDISILPKNFISNLRIGLVLFGVTPIENSLLNGFRPEQVMTFRTAVSSLKNLPKGAFIGYNKTYQLEKPSQIALLSVGYGDGLPRNAGGKLSVIVKDKLLPLVGIVSMDQAAVDASSLPYINENDEAIIIGKSESKEIKIEDYCKILNISPAEALTSITQRVPRFYTRRHI